jgi:glycosyltransferase A (GT-A) superfamily protein (DUF2064 family)
MASLDGVDVRTVPGCFRQIIGARNRVAMVTLAWYCSATDAVSDVCRLRRVDHPNDLELDA